MLMTQLPGYFRNRRNALMQSNPGATFIFPSNPDSIRNSDVHYPFRQDSNFFYLTGLDEPDSYLILTPSLSKPGAYKMILFVLPKDPEKEMWEGERYGIEGAQKIFGADEAFPIHELDKKLPEILQGCEKVFYRLGFHPESDRRVTTALESVRRSQGRTGKGLLPLEDPQGPLGEMRLFKSPEEAEIIRKACKVSALAHRTVMKEVRPGMNEFEVEALIDFVFRKEGCQRLGYPSIVAGGKNAACLHYRANNEVLQEGHLLLIDAGGEYQHYTADITRTFPVGKRFTEAQAQAYDLVFKAQKEAIALARPGVTLPQIHQKVCEVFVEGLLSMGLLKGKPEELLKNRDYRRFYPHSTSHWLGMDVHDVGLYLQGGEPRPLEAGMVFTIEPGFYVQPLDQETPARFRNLGIRIEDDLLITPKGCEVLTSDVPKERSEIESLRG